MRAIVKKGFATRLKGYYVGQEIEVSEEEAKDFANLISLIDTSETKSKTEDDKPKKKKRQIDESK